MIIYTDGITFFHRCCDDNLVFYNAFYKTRKDIDYFECYYDTCNIRIPKHLVLFIKKSYKTDNGYLIFLTESGSSEVRLNIDMDPHIYKPIEI